MKEIVLICEPRCEGSLLSGLVTILNLNRNQVKELIAKRKRLQRAISKSGIDKNSIQHIDLDEDVSFWLSKLPEQIDENWQDEGETIPGDESDDFLWRVLEDKNLDEDQMNIDLERLEVTSMRLSADGVCFSAYIKHNPSKHETATISWDELDDLLERFPKPKKRKKQKVK